MHLVLPVLLVGVALTLMISGLRRLSRPHPRLVRWRVVPPEYRVREEIDRARWQVVLGALVRLALGGALLGLACLLLSVE